MRNPMPKLSIITINYNHLDGLRRTIESVVNQTFTDYEWIVVDGGSTDGSRELLEQYKDHFAWWCSKPDTGVYNAMNKGIAHATGEYVNFMNSGDIFASMTILSEVFDAPRTADVLYGYMTLGTIDGESFWPEMMKPKLQRYDFYGATLNHQSTFTKREVFVKYGGFDESYRILADWRHFAQIIAVENVTTEFIPQKISIYEGGGLSITQNERVAIELKRIRHEVYPAFDDDVYNRLKKLEAASEELTRLCYVYPEFDNDVYKHLTELGTILMYLAKLKKQAYHVVSSGLYDRLKQLDVVLTFKITRWVFVVLYRINNIILKLIRK